MYTFKNNIVIVFCVIYLGTFWTSKIFIYLFHLIIFNLLCFPHISYMSFP